MPPEYLTNDGSVDIRNQDSDKTIVTPILPTTRKESFAHTDKTDIAAVTSNSAIDDHWIPTIIEHVGTNLLENSAKSFKALAKGVIRTSDTNISQAVHFLVETAKGIDASGSVASAAGQCLPILGLPRFKECFASIRADKINQPKAWEDVLKKHSQTRCYLKKQDAKYQPLSTENLIKKRETLRNDDDFVIDTVVFDAFDKYINAPHGESDETKDLGAVHFSVNLIEARRAG